MDPRDQKENGHRQREPSTTESRNPASQHIDSMSPIEIVRLMNAEDRRVVDSVREEADRIAQGIEMLTETWRGDHRVHYVGAGTSGRLGLLDAVELYPTFGVGEESVRTVLAGGFEAVYRAAEGAEDDEAAGATQVRKSVQPGDLVLGIAASGSTPFVLGAVGAAKEVGARTLGVTCNRPTPLEAHADLTIAAVVGPEVVTGSTRLKAGTAQKMILNMLSTGAMIRLGKVYQNLMVDLRVSNQKLKERAVRIVRESTGASEDAAAGAIAAAGGHAKTAIVMLKAGVEAGEATRLLAEADGFIRNI